MKVKMLVVFACLAIAVAAAWYDTTQTPSAPSGMELTVNTLKPLAPNMPFTTVEGKKYPNLHALPQPTLLLNFWASWCVPCIVELPDMLKLAAESNGTIGLVAISIDDNKAAMESFRQRLLRQVPQAQENPNIYWVWDADKTLSLATFNVAKVPETIILNVSRHMVQKIVGERDWKAAKQQPTGLFILRKR